jgi:nucleoside-diphosphate kinase
MDDAHAQIEQTLVLLKPDAVARSLVGRIIERFEDVLLKIAAMKMVQMDSELVKAHYHQAVERHGVAVYDLAEKFMLTAPVVALVLEGVDAIAIARKIIGSTYPAAAAPGTIRGDFAHQAKSYSDTNNIAVANVVHASESLEEARREIALWFHPAEVLSYSKPSDSLAFKVR